MAWQLRHLPRLQSRYRAQCPASTVAEIPARVCRGGASAGHYGHGRAATRSSQVVGSNRIVGVGIPADLPSDLSQELTRLRSPDRPGLCALSAWCFERSFSPVTVGIDAAVALAVHCRAIVLVWLLPRLSSCNRHEWHVADAANQLQ